MDEFKELDRLLNDTIKDLKAASRDPVRERAAIKRYLERGQQLELSPYECWDYFAISSPGIYGEAGYKDLEAERIVKLFETISTEIFGE